MARTRTKPSNSSSPSRKKAASARRGAAKRRGNGVGDLLETIEHNFRLLAAMLPLSTPKPSAKRAKLGGAKRRAKAGAKRAAKRGAKKVVRRVARARRRPDKRPSASAPI